MTKLEDYLNDQQYEVSMLAQKLKGLALILDSEKSSDEKIGLSLILKGFADDAAEIAENLDSVNIAVLK